MEVTKTEPMAQCALLTDSLDLMALPERLDDETRKRVNAIAYCRLPPELAAPREHLNKCLRFMLAALPKRSQDDVSGELLIAAYQRKLGHLSVAQLSYIADKALGECKWFPTIAECLDMLESYRRNDDMVQRQAFAARIYNREIEACDNDRRTWDNARAHFMTQEQVDAMTDQVKRIGVACGALLRGDDGKITPRRLQPENSDPNF